jgi:hypothetical protein
MSGLIFSESLQSAADCSNATKAKQENTDDAIRQLDPDCYARPGERHKPMNFKPCCIASSFYFLLHHYNAR